MKRYYPRYVMGTKDQARALLSVYNNPQVVLHNYYKMRLRDMGLIEWDCHSLTKKGLRELGRWYSGL